MVKEERREAQQKRSDAKRAVGPKIFTGLYDPLATTAYQTDSDLKPTLEAFILAAAYSKDVLDALSKHFRRDLTSESAMYFGDANRKRLRPPRAPKGVDFPRVQVKFTDAQFRRIAAIAFALDCTPATACVILAVKAMQNADLAGRVTAQLAATPRRPVPNPAPTHASQTPRTTRRTSSSVRLPPLGHGTRQTAHPHRVGR